VDLREIRGIPVRVPEKENEKLGREGIEKDGTGQFSLTKKTRESGETPMPV
jgi:hypothetical protein